MARPPDSLKQESIFQYLFTKMRGELQPTHGVPVSMRPSLLQPTPFQRMIAEE
jgi:hypothetical protein